MVQPKPPNDQAMDLANMQSPPPMPPGAHLGGSQVLALPDPNRVPGLLGHAGDTNQIIEAIRALEWAYFFVKYGPAGPPGPEGPSAIWAPDEPAARTTGDPLIQGVLWVDSDDVPTSTVIMQAYTHMVDAINMMQPSSIALVIDNGTGNAQMVWTDPQGVLHSIAGITGQTGPVGPAGPLGPAGPVGPAPSFSTDVFRLPPGSQPDVTAIDLGNGLTELAFHIPDGATGAAGATGATGPQGPVGRQSVIGAKLPVVYDNVKAEVSLVAMTVAQLAGR